jgi:hypothetical protein
VKLNDRGGLRKMFKPLRNQNGRLLGLVRDYNGRTELRDAGGRLLGYYYQKANQTRDKNGHLVGYGNLLTKLLYDL